MAAVPLRKGWLTSLVPTVATRGKEKSRFINARPIKFLRVPQISFVQNISNQQSTTDSYSNSPVADQRAIESSTATLEKDNDPALLQLSRDTSALTVGSSPDEIPRRTGKNQISCQEKTQDQEPATTNLDSQQQNHHGPIHFYRRTHQNVHNHNALSNPSPLTSERRKYALPNPRSRNPHALAINTDLTAHLRPPTPEPISPTTIKQCLENFLADENWDHNTEECERTNPFPHHDQNYGWTRARCSGLIYFSTEWSPYGSYHTLDGSMEEMTHVKRSFARFSLWAQREAMEFDEGEMRGVNGWGHVFDMVFKGEGLALCWARTPGCWHAVKPGLLTCCSSVSFHDEVLHATHGIRERVRGWRARNEGWRDLQAASARRKFKVLWPGSQDGERFQRQSSRLEAFVMDVDGAQPSAKKMRLRRNEPERIMSEEWRARRREQEKKAGRWLDGTPRQDRLWDNFHWVLDVGDPRDHVWPRRRRRSRKRRGGVRGWNRM